MFWIYDTKEKKTINKNFGYDLRYNAERRCQALNIKHCGVEETNKPEDKRRFVIKG